jgi:hypothetical protein
MHDTTPRDIPGRGRSGDHTENTWRKRGDDDRDSRDELQRNAIGEITENDAGADLSARPSKRREAGRRPQS